MQKKLVLLFMLLAVLTTGCHKDKPQNQGGLIKPTESSTEATTEPDTKLNIENPDDSIIELPQETAPEQIMLIPGSDGEAIAITGDIQPEDISDPVAKENYEQMLGLPEDNGNTPPADKNTPSDNEDNSTTEETLSHEQYTKMEQDIRAYTDRQAEEWDKIANEGGQ